MKCERLVTMFKVVLDHDDEHDEMILRSIESQERTWELLASPYHPTVLEMYELAKSIFACSDRVSVGTIVLPVFGKRIAVDRETTKEEYLTNIIGDEPCDANILGRKSM